MKERKIRNDVPFPARGKYNFGEMNISDCIIVPNSEWQRVRAASHQYGKNHNLKFACYQLDDGRIGVWRIS